MIRYHFDLYPRDDPKDGTRLVRFTKLQTAEYRLEANGTGAGRFSIRADDAEAAFVDPRGLQYVRVVEDLDSVERVVGGFWLENGDFESLTANQTRLLTFGGAGTLAYLQREILWSRAYNYVADNIIDTSGTWHFYNQASITGGDFLGGVAFRVITEALSFDVSPTETDDKADTAIPDVILGGALGAFNDSAGNAWSVPSGEFKAQVGDTVLSVLKRLMEAGLYIEMHPDTFALNVWERGAGVARGEVKTGAAWAATDDPVVDGRVIRFQAPTDGTIATGNIKSDAKRGIAAFLRASTVLAGDNGTFAAETDATVDVPWHRFYPSDTQDTDTLSNIADTQLEAREDAADTLRLRMKLGDDPGNGFYRPFEWEPVAETGLDGLVMVEDEVTVHTGTGQWDYNEDTFPVAALTIALRPGGDWDAFADLGSTYTSMAERAFQARGVATHSHPPNPALCQALTPGTETVTRLYFLQSNEVAITQDAGWDVVDGDGNFNGNDLGAAANTHGPGSDASSTGGGSGVTTDVCLSQHMIAMTADLASTIAAGGATFRAQARTNARHGVGVSEASQDLISQVSVRVVQSDGSTVRGTALALHSLANSSGLAKWPASATARNRVFPPTGDGTLSAVSGAVAGDYLVVEMGYRNFTAATATGGSIFFFDSTTAGDLPEDEVETQELNSWVELRFTPAPSGSGNHPDLVGTSVQAARCDHKHHILSNRAPTTAENIDQGYPETTLWTNTDTAQTYLLTDEDAGTWMLIGTAGEHTHDAGDITGLSVSGLGWFNVIDYGAVGDGTTDDTAAINLAIADYNTNGGGVLYFPAGHYQTTGSLTSITAGGLILGDGHAHRDGTTEAVSLIDCSSTTASLFTIASHAVTMRGLALVQDGSTPSAGAGITVTSGGHARYENLSVSGFFVGIDIQDGEHWGMTGCYIYNTVSHGIKIAHTDLPDGGDWSIVSSWVTAAARTAAGANAISITAAGGGKITNVKINADGTTRYTNGIALTSTTTTSVFLFGNNSIENVSNHAFSLTTTGSGELSHIIFHGNQTAFWLGTNNTGKAISIVGGGTADFGGIVISSNVFYAGGTIRSAIQLTNCDDVTLVGNAPRGSFTSLYSETTSTNITEIVAGVTDHGALTGLADDDHTHYLNEARHDALAHTGVGGEILISDTPAGTPLVFGDLLQNEAQDDLLYEG